MQVLKRRWLFGLSVLFALFYISFGTVLQGVGEFDDNGERKSEPISCAAGST